MTFVKSFYGKVNLGLFLSPLHTTEHQIARVGVRLLSSDVDKKSDSSPLSGIQILDLTRIVAGPFCTMTLGDLGAQVIKIERPGGGDECRNWGPPYVNATAESCYFVAVNRNKQSVCVNLQHASGRRIMYDLADKCDVLVENYVPGKLKSLGLGYEDFKDRSPHLIYCSLMGYGSEGPYSNRPGYDVIAASLGGLLHITGPENGEPCKVGVAMTDLATGLYAHGAIMAALFQRTRTGRGQKIDCNLLATQVACLINIGSNYLNGGRESKRWGTAHESLVPYEAFPTKDNGYLTVCAGSNDQFVSLCRKLELPELVDDPRFKSNESRVRNREVLVGILRRRFAEKTTAEWLTALAGAPFPYGPVNTLAQVFDDPHVRETGMVQEVEHPITGRMRVVGPPVRYSEGENRIRSPPPLIGEHTDQVLREVLRYTDKEIRALRDEKAIQ